MAIGDVEEHPLSPESNGPETPASDMPVEVQILSPSQGLIGMFELEPVVDTNVRVRFEFLLTAEGG